MKLVIQITLLLVLSVTISYAQDVNKKIERIENRIEKLENKLESTKDSIEVIVKVADIPTDKGVIRIAIYDNANSAFDEDLAIAKAIINADSKGVEKSFLLVPGKYAIAVFHDENNNGYVDTNFLGIPKERYGFSGGSNKPDYKKAEVNFRRSQDIVIKLK